MTGPIGARPVRHLFPRDVAFIRHNAPHAATVAQDRARVGRPFSKVVDPIQQKGQ